jgi:hypothetical protein
MNDEANYHIKYNTKNSNKDYLHSSLLKLLNMSYRFPPILHLGILISILYLPPGANLKLLSRSISHCLTASAIFFVGRPQPRSISCRYTNIIIIVITCLKMCPDLGDPEQTLCYFTFISLSYISCQYHTSDYTFAY